MKISITKKIFLLCGLMGSIAMNAAQAETGRYHDRPYHEPYREPYHDRPYNHRSYQIHSGIWQCEAVNGHGRTFIGLGARRGEAFSRAQAYCVDGSRWGRSCIVRNCHR